jgi:hypothetical protein
VANSMGSIAECCIEEEYIIHSTSSGLFPLPE